MGPETRPQTVLLRMEAREQPRCCRWPPRWDEAMGLPRYLRWRSSSSPLGTPPPVSFKTPPSPVPSGLPTPRVPFGHLRARTWERGVWCLEARSSACLPQARISQARR